MSLTSKILNRDVFMLIDASGSMTKPDESTDQMIRFDYIKESVEADVRSILGHQVDESRICEKISLCFFNTPEVKDFQIINSDEQIQNAFFETVAQGGTSVDKTLQKCIDDWLAEGRKDKRGACIIIYTDGEINNPEKFAKILSSCSSKLTSQEEIDQDYSDWLW